MRPLYWEKGSTSVKSKHKTTTAETCISFWIKKRLQGRTTKNYNEPRRTCGKPRKSKCRSEEQEGKHLQPQILRRKSLSFSGLIPVDAAAKVDGGEVLSDGDGARAAAEVAR